MTTFTTKEAREQILDQSLRMPSRTPRVEVSTREYEFSHGKRPRGFGSWAFFLDRSMSVGSAFWVHQSTYGDAVRKAKEWAKNLGEPEIFVGS